MLQDLRRHGPALCHHNNQQISGAHARLLCLRHSQIKHARAEGAWPQRRRLLGSLVERVVLQGRWAGVLRTVRMLLVMRRVSREGNTAAAGSCPVSSWFARSSARSCGSPAAARSTADTEPAHALLCHRPAARRARACIAAHPHIRGALAALWE